MRYFMSTLSLLSSILPQGYRDKFHLTCTKNVEQETSRKVLRIAALLLTITIEATKAIQEGRCKQFDALIGNFGCQITALEVQRLMRTENLSVMAKEIQAKAEEQFKQCQIYINAPPKGLHMTTMIQYLKDKNLDQDVCPEIAKLTRLRILNIVNTNVLKDGKEVPQTKYAKLNDYNNIKKLDQGYIVNLVECLQEEESISAAKFIKNVSKELCEKEISQGPLLRRVLAKKMRCTTLPPTHLKHEAAKGRIYGRIVSVPLIYNTEAVLRGIDGILLLKNKLKLCGKEIPDAKPLQIILKMPEERVLLPDEIGLLSESEPIFVIEGYVRKEDWLRECVNQKGLLNLIKTGCLIENQYAVTDIKDNCPCPLTTIDMKSIPTKENPLLADVEAHEEIEILKNGVREAIDIFEIDHMYCATLKEELK